MCMEKILALIIIGLLAPENECCLGGEIPGDANYIIELTLRI